MQHKALSLDVPPSNYLRDYVQAREMMLSQVLTMRLSMDDEALRETDQPQNL